MKYIFYFFALFAIIYEVCCFLEPSKVIKRNKSIKGKRFDDYTSSEKTLGAMSVLYWVWCFVGLFTFQWPLFLLIILFSLVPKRYVIIVFIDSLLTLAILLLIVINAFHLHIDVWNLIKQSL